MGFNAGDLSPIKPASMAPPPPSPPPMRKVIEPSLGVIGVAWLALLPASLFFLIGFVIGRGM